jgi:hypothetical protein
MSFRRLAGLAGFVFVLLIVVNGALLGSQPSADAQVQKLVEYISEDTTIHKLAAVVGQLVLIPAILFFAGLLIPFRASDRDNDEGWAWAIVFGAIALAGTVAIGDAVFLGLIFRGGGGGLDNATVRGLWDVQYVAYASSGVAVAVVAASVAVPVLMHRLQPPWYGFLSLLVAVLGLISVAGAVLTSTLGQVLGFVGVLAFVIWVLASSVLMYQEVGVGSPSAEPRSS